MHAQFIWQGERGEMSKRWSPWGVEGEDEKEKENDWDCICFCCSVCFSLDLAPCPHPGSSSCTMGQPRWFTDSLHQWVIHCHGPRPHPSCVSAHCGAPRLVEDVQQAPSPWRQWDESQGTSCVHWGSALWFSEGIVEHCVYRRTPTQALHTLTHPRNTILETDRKFNKEPCCSKGFSLTQEKHTKQCFVHVKQCFACFLPISCYSKSVQHTYTFLGHITQEGRNP